MDCNYIGLMSGTSADSIDAVIVSIIDNDFKLLTHYSHPIPKSIKQKIWLMNTSRDDELKSMLELDYQLAHLFSDAVKYILKKSSVIKSSIVAIGSHGQTIRHYPESDYPASLQIADANIIVEQTGITTISDFRRADLAAGGQGAPLVPAFHQSLFQDQQRHRVILNIGGIANITYLPSIEQSGLIIGYDTGPGNGLMDEWIQKHKNQEFDTNGGWAKSGEINNSLLSVLLEHPFFHQPHPKSTGRDIFNLTWLEALLNSRAEFQKIRPEDIQKTLCALTAQTIADAILCLPKVNEIYVCGGGVKNSELIRLLSSFLTNKNIQITSTSELGLNPDWVEACAFAWLAHRRIQNKPGNCPSVTGAQHHCVLGAIYQQTNFI